MPLHIVSSNHIEELCLALTERLFVQGSDPFARRLLVVPSTPMRSWLQLRFADSLAIAACYETLYLEEALSLLQGRRSPRSTAIALALEALFIKIKTEGDELQGKMPCLQQERQASVLAEELGWLFRYYLDSQSTLTASWNQSSQPSSNWQKQLWHRLWEHFSSEPLKTTNEVESLHLFIPSFINRDQLTLLEKAPFPVTLYHLSASLNYLGDLCTAKEQARLQHFWEKKGASLKERETLDLLILGGHPFLGNQSRLMRNTLLNLQETSSFTEEERYLTPAFLEEEAAYASFLPHPSASPVPGKKCGLLQLLQADFLFQRAPVGGSDPLPLKTDESLLLHRTSSLRQEVEVLHATLAKLIEKGNQTANPLTPSQILVLAQDISPYVPYLKQTVADLGFFFNLIDLPLVEESPLFSLFLKFLDLREERWSVPHLMELLSSPHLLKKQEWGADSLEEIQRWIEEGGIVWGYDQAHRQECLGSSKDSPGSWKEGLEKILITSLQEPGKTVNRKLLSELLELLKTLRRETLLLKSGNLRPLKEWSALLHRLLESFFAEAFFPEEEGFVRVLRKLLHQLENSLQLFPQLENENIPFCAVYHSLKQLIVKEKSGYREQQLQGIRCGSLAALRGIPARVICVLGMSDAAHPSQEKTSSLDLSRGSPLRNYTPSKSDVHRHLIVETILSAREHLIFSYPADADRENSSKEALPLTELFHYCDEAFSFEGSKPSHSLTIDHTSSGKSGKKEATPRYEVIRDWLLPESFERPPGDSLDLKELQMIARHPLQTYLNRRAGIFLKRKERWQYREEEFLTLSQKDHFLVRNELLRRPLEEGIRKIGCQHRWPPGLYGAVAVDRLEEEAVTKKANLEAMGISLDNCFQVELRRDCDSAHFSTEGVLFIPAISISVGGKPLTLFGSLGLCSPQGLVVHQKKDTASLTRLWPTYLIFLLLYQQGILKPFCKEGSLLLTQSGHKLPELALEAEKLLEQYLLYALNSLKKPSPLMPEWLKELFDEKIPDSSSGSYGFTDPYLDWLNETAGFELPAELPLKWKETLERLFKSPMQAWL